MSVEPVRTAVVTGAGARRGIGYDLANRLAGHGWCVALLDIDEAAVVSASSRIVEEYGVLSIGCAVDIGSEEEVDKAARMVEAQLPPVVALANCAGISDPTSFFDITLAGWERAQRVNATGTFLVTQRFVRGMVDRKYGRVVSLSSGAAQDGGGLYSKAAYAASKAAIEGMSRGVAHEVAEYGVTVNVVSPSIIDTDIMGGRIEGERLERYASIIPVGRIGRPDEVSALVEFLFSSEAGYITGVTYNINGGVRIG